MLHDFTRGEGELGPPKESARHVALEGSQVSAPSGREFKWLASQGSVKPERGAKGDAHVQPDKVARSSPGEIEAGGR
eukprot:4706571-Alexandrium_andersonii.AAC.1